MIDICSISCVIFPQMNAIVIIGSGWDEYREFNTLSPGKFEWNFRHVIFKQILVIDGWCISCEIALLWISQDFTDGQARLVQVMDWCRQATSHYLSQCWPRSLSPYGVTTPQWVKYSSQVQVMPLLMAWWHQAARHRVIQSWIISMFQWNNCTHLMQFLLNRS